MGEVTKTEHEIRAMASTRAGEAYRDVVHSGKAAFNMTAIYTSDNEHWEITVIVKRGKA